MCMSCGRSDQLVTFNELRLSCDRHVSKVEDLSEEGFPSGPLHELISWEEEQAECKSDQKDDLE